MELGPVEAIQAARPVGSSRSPGDVTPAFAVEGSGRMEDDSYGGERKQQDRGMEEDTVELGADAEEAEDTAEVAVGNEARQVNLFA